MTSSAAAAKLRLFAHGGSESSRRTYLRSVILRCEPCGALAPLGEPRRMSGHGPGRRPSRRGARAPLLRLTGRAFSKPLGADLSPPFARQHLFQDAATDVLVGQRSVAPPP